MKSIPCFIFILLTNIVFAQEKYLLDSTVRFDYLGGDTVASLKNVYFYDETARLLEKMEQNISPLSQDWEPQTQESYHYLDEGNLIDTSTIWGFEETERIPVSRIINHYEQRVLREIMTQEWNDSIQMWVNLSRTIIGLSGANQSFVAHSQWDSGTSSWVKLDSVVSFHQNGVKTIADTTYAWVQIAHEYLKSAATNYLYDSIDQLILRTRYNYDFENSIFKPRSRDTFAYDSDGFQVLSQFDTWLSALQIWEPSFRISRTTNADGRLAMSNTSFYDFISGVLRPTSRLEYTYTDGNARSEKDSLFYSVKNYVYQGPFEIPDYVRYYYYRPQNLTADKKHQFIQIKVYPNPASDVVQVQGDLKAISQFRWMTMDGDLLSQGVMRDFSLKIPVVTEAPLLLLLLSQDGYLLKVEKIFTH
ncbi:MAG: hypothetical protein KDC80_24880 [Saprospiraceae bacterium]|nr:hypothetical protein [Saprospiraceae bacterium]